MRLRSALFGWFARVALLACASLAASCSTVLGFEEPQSEQPCLLNSECEPGKVCIFRACSVQCAQDVDCGPGFRCLKTASANACVDARQAGCEQTCPEGTACATDNVCRSPCTIAGDCLIGQTCRDKSCVGSSSIHDPILDAGAREGGSDDGGRPDVSQPDGPGPNSNDAGSEATADASTDGGPLNCTPEGAIRCEGNAQAARSICQGGKWVGTDPCAGGTLCDTGSSPAGACKQVASDCFGRKPNEPFCNGATRTVCGPDLVSAQTTVCMSAQHCAAGTTGCAVCLDNEYSCDVDRLLKCNATHSGFDVLKTCTATAPCSAAAGDCTTHACSPMQKRCNGDRLEQCNADQSAFVVVQTCDPGLCDSAKLVCDKCVAQSVACANPSTVRTCSADGLTQTDTPCPTGMAFCAGTGVCVQCRDLADCTAPNDCRVAACNAGSCGSAPKGSGVTCNGGVCDGAGACVQCLAAAQCTATSECYTATCGVDHKCGNMPKGSGVTCATGYCDGNGACVQCLTPAQCTPSNDCNTATCTPGHACGNTPKAANAVCGGGYCNGSGACVPCTLASQCTATGECYTATCNVNMCGSTAKSASSPCSTGVCNGSGICVPCVAAVDCGASEVCHSSMCVNAIHDVGWDTALPTSTSMLANWLYLFRLPPLTHNAQLKNFGTWGNSGVALARLALYADNGGSTPAPTGAPLATSPSFGLTDGQREFVATPTDLALSAGTVYWIAIVVNTGTTFRTATDGAQNGMRFPQQYGATDLQTRDGMQGQASGGLDWAVYIKIQDID